MIKRRHAIFGLTKFRNRRLLERFSAFLSLLPLPNAESRLKRLGMRSRACLRGMFLCLGLFLLSQGVFATTTWFPIPQFFSTVGQPLAGGQVFTYAAGTTTPQPSYTDSTGLVQNPNPIILDSTGKPTQGIWLSSSAYKIVVEDSNGNIQWFQDNLIFGSSVMTNAFSSLTASTNSNVGSFVASGNTWNYNNATLLSPLFAGYAPTASSSFGYDSTNNKYVFGQNGATVSFAIAGTCAANQFVNALSATVTSTCAQPAFSNLSGQITAGQIPSGIALTSPTIGGTTITNVPTIIWGGMVEGLNTTSTLSSWPTNGGVTITSFSINLNAGTTGCGTFPVFSVEDNGSIINSITLTSGTQNYSNTGLSLNVASGHTLSLQESTGGAGCTGTAFGGFTVVYRMQ